MEVTEHGTLYQIKGINHCECQPGYTGEDRLSALKEKKISFIYNIKRNLLGIMNKTLIYVLTLDACILPSSVTIGWTPWFISHYQDDVSYHTTKTMFQV